MIFEASTIDEIPEEYRYLIKNSKPDNLYRVNFNIKFSRWFINIDTQKNELHAHAAVEHFGVRSLLLTTCFVYRKFRGLGIQYELIKARERYAIQWNYKELLGVSSVNNIISANNFIKSGFTLTKPWNDDSKNFIYFRKQL